MTDAEKQLLEAQRKQFTGIFCEVIRECIRSRRLHGPFPTTHHGEGVIREEFEELWAEIKTKHPRRDLMRTEAIQLAAAAIHFITDLCEEPLTPATPQMERER